MQKLRHIFWLIRPVNLFFIALTAYAVRFWLLQPFFKRFELEFFTSNFEFSLLVLSFVCIAGGGNAINDYFDTKADLVNKPNNAIVNVHLDRRYAMWTHQVLSMLGFFLAAYYAFINDTLLLLSFHGFAIVSLWYYSFEFKKRFLLGNVVVALLTAFVPFSTGLFELLPVIKHQDQIGDKTIGRKTVPIVLGQKKAKLITQALLLILLALLAYAAKYYLGDELTTAYFVLALGIPVTITLVLVQKNNFKWASNVLKLVMLFGICYLYFVENQFF